MICSARSAEAIGRSPPNGDYHRPQRPHLVDRIDMQRCHRWGDRPVASTMIIIARSARSAVRAALVAAPNAYQCLAMPVDDQRYAAMTNGARR